MAKAQPGKLFNPADLHKLMRSVNMGKVGNKNSNFKDMKKANIRRNEKINREKEKLIGQRLEEALEKERVEWAITEKDDEKY